MIWRESGGMGKCSKALTNCKNTGNAEARIENSRVFIPGLWDVCSPMHAISFAQFHNSVCAVLLVQIYYIIILNSPITFPRI